MTINIKAKILTVVVAFCAVVLIFENGKISNFYLFGFILFAILTLIAESSYIPIKETLTMSVSFAVIFSALILFGPLTAALCSIFTAITLRDLKEHTSVYHWLFNGSQYLISTSLCGYVYLYLGGHFIFSANVGLSSSDFPNILIPVVVAAIVFFISNTMLVSLIISLQTDRSFRNIWNIDYRDYIVNYLSTIPISLALAEVYFTKGILGLSLFVIPLIIVRFVFMSYLQSHENAASIIKTLISAIEAKDKYTRQHSERVANYVDIIARSMSMPEKELVQLNYAAYLHDIGKMAVQRRVLNKPQKLTDLEFKMMKRHPAVGYKIVNQIDMLKHVSEPILKHHEFINGKGYPLGTTDLPLSARIIAVADAFDAMTSLRPYRHPLSIDQAFIELQKSAGTQFDPMIVQYLKKGLAHESQDQLKHDKPSINQAQLQLDLAV